MKSSILVTAAIAPVSPYVTNSFQRRYPTLFSLPHTGLATFLASLSPVIES